MHLTEEHSKKLRVLVAEDDVQIGPLLKDLLAGHDMVVIGPMRSVAEAIAAVRTDAIDCALLDVRLHGGEAGPVAEELLRHAVPYIVMTGGGRGAVAGDPTKETLPCG
jgi:DNA-binding NtrC family response regulator